MQNLLNWADRASTVPNRSSNKFSGKNGALPAQTMTIPVTTGANRDATVLNLGLYRPITGANRGVSIGSREWHVVGLKSRAASAWITKHFVTIFSKTCNKYEFRILNSRFLG